MQETPLRWDTTRSSGWQLSSVNTWSCPLNYVDSSSPCWGTGILEGLSRTKTSKTKTSRDKINPGTTKAPTLTKLLAQNQERNKFLIPGHYCFYIIKILTEIFRSIYGFFFFKLFHYVYYFSSFTTTYKNNQVNFVDQLIYLCDYKWKENVKTSIINTCLLWKPVNFFHT